MRNFVIAVGALSLVIGIALLMTGGASPSIVFLAWGAILVLSIAFERFRYKPLESKSPGPGWERTTERFVDEETGKLVTVYIRPETGERIYAQE